MSQESITRGILAGIIDRYIIEIAEDPNRSIRKLLDMAERTSNGPTQKICYQMMQEMAANQSSPYYEMIHHMVTNVSPRTVREIGLNLGHNAWTFGPGHMRQLSENRGLMIPWAVLIDRRLCPERIPFREIAELVDRGRKMEIYAWLLMPGDSADEWEDYAELCHTHRDSVFGLCVSPAFMSPEIQDAAAEIPNLMLLLDTDAEGWQELAGELERRGCMFSAFRTVSDEADASEILSGNWFGEMVPCHPLVAFTFIADDCPEQTAEAVARYMWDTRLDQVYPILPSDLISDFLIISRLVSHKEVLFRIEADGTVAEGIGRHFVRSDLQCRKLFKPADPAQ